ncbi:unnamed protein product [Tilletia controversa]|nr:hypothetical protein CF328_g5765 [Tilletia controversa]CAD6967347.1 unnamed protein product [Tilletia controversa]
MRLSITQVLAAAVLATSVAAASSSLESSNIVVRSASDVKAHAHASASASGVKHNHTAEAKTRKEIKHIQDDLKMLHILKGHKDVTPEMERPIFLDIHKHTTSASAALKDVLKAYKMTDKRDIKFVEPSVLELVTDLNTVLHQANKLVNNVAHGTGLDGLNAKVVAPVGQVLAAAVNEVESILYNIAPSVGRVGDPVLNEVSEDLDFLGINLRRSEAQEMKVFGSDLVERKEEASAASKAAPKAQEGEIEHIQKHLSTVTDDLAKLKALKAAGKSHTPEGQALLKSVLKNAAAASKALDHVTHHAGKKQASSVKGSGKKRADQGIFGGVLVRAVHDLVCVLHAVIELTVNLLGNLDAQQTKSLVKTVDSKAFEPLFSGVKNFSKQVGGGLEPLVDPLLVSVQTLTAILNLN